MANKYERFTDYNPENLGKARQLRREMTKPERRLWYDFLKTYPVRFYKQRPIDRYIVDFYSSKAMLVIELDGDQHGEEAAAAYDRDRTEALKRLGLEVLRFSNADVNNGFTGVCAAIHEEVKARLRQAKDNATLAELEALERQWEDGAL